MSAAKWLPVDFPTLDTERLRLRELNADDAPVLLAIHSDRDAMRWFGSDPLTDLAAAAARIERFAALRTHANPGVRWGITSRQSGELIGTLGLFGWNPDWRRCLTGYELARAHWGRGYMREALVAVIDWTIRHTDLHRLEAIVHPDNQRSLRVIESLGFAREGLLRQIARWDDAQHDMLQYALLRPDWLALRAAAH